MDVDGNSNSFTLAGANHGDIPDIICIIATDGTFAVSLAVER